MGATLTRPPGADGEAYEFTQAVPSAEWVVTHNLNRVVAVTVVDSAGNEVWGEVLHEPGDVQVRILFSSAFSGKALIS